MSTNIQSATSQLQMLTQNEQFFEQKLENETKVAKAKRDLKKTLSDASSDVKAPMSKDGKPLVSPALAYLLAVKDSTDQRLKDMAYHVCNLQNNDSEISRSTTQLTNILTQEDQVASLSPDDMAPAQAQLSAQLTIMNNQVSSLGQKESQETSYFTQDTSNNVADATKGRTMIQMIVDNEGNYGKAKRND